MQHYDERATPILLWCLVSMCFARLVDEQQALLQWS
jgi:hypothetical protein